ncbi:hypothetical protein OHB44_27995 [Micromonospora sp. NBC_00821]|uniref:hypothetical protein n=1 Tax=Micromonospora sp. NBC_00821 TaxID=2975977 RepID=UPI002ED291AA|nr:hypothetical protein OHB44_27995 [Micromonospora sp. NBC_00821]
MASLKQVRAAVRSTLEPAIPGLKVHSTVPGSAAGDVVVVQPSDEQGANFVVAMGRGSDTYQFDLLVLVPNGSLDVAQDQLDDYVTGAGGKSIREAVWNARHLGLAHTDAHVAYMSDYGADHTLGSTQYLGATLRLVVTTKGTE